jgi:uncharacterized protein YndB with AHSA1/START domain
MADYAERTPDWIVTAPLLNEQTRTIRAPREVVWARIADHQTWPEWFRSIKRVAITGSPSGIGGRREVRLPGVTVKELFTAWEPGELFAFTVVSGPPGLIALAESVELVDVDGGTRITYRQGFEPRRGWGWLVAPVVRKARRDLAAALDRLAAVVEIG